MYTKYLEIPHSWGLKPGDVVLLSSDVSRLSFNAFENDELFDPNLFLDEVYSIIGDEGTLLIPTYNWEFCHGQTFDYYKTPCKTGALGKVALKRKDFVRTKHPIYSFAVKGKYQDLLVKMNNVSSFGADSPFAFLEMMKAKNVIIDVNLTNCFSFVHYMEEKAGVDNYRYQKEFKAGYKDENGAEDMRTYSMLVRDLNYYYSTDFDPLEEDLKNMGVMEVVELNGILFRIVDLFEASKFIMEDIRNNASRKLCKHKWQ